MTMHVEARRGHQAEDMALRIATVAAWLAVAWAAAPLAQVSSVEAVVVVPLVVVAVGAVLLGLERRGAGAVGLTLTGTAVSMLAAATWGALGGTLLLVSGIGALVSSSKEAR
ncbi:hypothetical protein AB0B45_02205 [Nonomuraea sp. NPDC049152]|uniref:hypothetical protein n=1 Tax=Nonomuraea sp. NPDC049152 TaxID=3154350 RepID=UPI0033FCDFBD